MGSDKKFEVVVGRERERKKWWRSARRREAANNACTGRPLTDSAQAQRTEPGWPNAAGKYIHRGRGTAGNNVVGVYLTLVDLVKQE